MRLRRVSQHDRGWRRVRHGRGFRYLDENGEPLAPEDVERVRALVIPPAWTEVWICPHPRGHLQAVGTDGAGRRQYLYHPQWRSQRDLEKFDRVIDLGEKLPGLRRRLRRELSAEVGENGTERTRVLALAVRLIDLGCFRPGSEQATAENETHGLTTLERRHVTCRNGTVTFRFVGKAEVDHEIVIEDPVVVEAVTRLRRTRRSDPRLLATRTGRRWHPVTPEEVNEHIRQLTGLDVTAKDFRTWHATVTVAAELARPPAPESARARKRRVNEALAEAADLLGNTPTVARSSYVDPRVLDLFESGTVLAPLPEGPDALDRAVARLLRAESG
ncbi:DNA topoisomerase IB [Marmoricola sp. RAF53]|uniref:DNA topoisomerase IB n=1 Tax=Marmoricola sp. RAF53 TaxID=3233059 RepID=UPI003F9CFB75